MFYTRAPFVVTAAMNLTKKMPHVKYNFVLGLIYLLLTILLFYYIYHWWVGGGGWW